MADGLQTKRVNKRRNNVSTVIYDPGRLQPSEVALYQACGRTRGSAAVGRYRLGEVGPAGLALPGQGKEAGRAWEGDLGLDLGLAGGI